MREGDHSTTPAGLPWPGTGPLIPLKPGTKVPAVAGWAQPDYVGVESGSDLGLRCDGLVVVDCDNLVAARQWLDTHPAPMRVVKTPRGFHFYYSATPESPTGPMVRVLPDVDIRAGSGSFVVVPPTPGYKEVQTRDLVPFNPAWLPSEQEKLLAEVQDGWDTVPEGRRNNTLTAMAGMLRKQGASETVMLATLKALNRAVCDPPLPDEDVRTIVRSVGRYAPDPDFDVVPRDTEPALHSESWLIRADQLGQPRPVRWLLSDLVLQGELTHLDGREGIGKGLFCVYLAALTVEAGGGVIWLSAEDSPRDTIVPRLRAAGVSAESLERVYFHALDVPFSLEKDSRRLRDEVLRLGVRLIIVDPVKSYGGGSQLTPDSNNDLHARALMGPLSAIAQGTDISVVSVGHWRKGSDDLPAADRSHGSVGFRQVARGVVSMARRGEPGAISLTKCNLGPTGYTVEFTIETRHVEFDGGSREYPVLQLGSQYDGDLATWMRAQRGTAKRPSRDYAALAEAIHQQAATDGKLPSKSKVCNSEWSHKAFGKAVSEHAVRKALGLLEGSGRAERREGLGWYRTGG